MSQPPLRVLLIGLLVAHCISAQTVGQALPPWSPGTLDIHQIQTGRGNAAFLVFPDGHTLLIDAGAVPDRAGLELGPARPDATRTPAEWIAQYIRDFSPRTPATLDYALITHYHDDHMGAFEAVARAIPIHKLLDRGDSPAPPGGQLVARYREFRRSLGPAADTIRPGQADQIVVNYPDFEVRAVAANGDVWTGQGTATRSAFPKDWQTLPAEIRPSENSFSAALRIRYGRFSYFTGGDLVGVPLENLPAWHDLETPVARAIGAVDVLVLNHHGWLDTTNPFFLQTLQPNVVILPAWHASHPDHGVLRRLLSARVYPHPADLFATTVLDAPRAVFSYLRDPFQSAEGHIVVRVQPGGAQYSVIVLDDSSPEHLVKTVRGPYASRAGPRN